jgi:hypothetical protein
MGAPADPGAAARRVALWAAFLVLPLVLGALLLPRVAGWLRGGGPAAAAPPSVEGLRALAGAAADPAAAGAAPRPPAGPTTGQIEAAREAEVALAEAQRGWARTQTIAPREPARDEGGDLVSPFEGFGLDVVTEPAGARVLVDGRDLGETPLLAAVPCRPGTTLEVVLERRGARRHRQAVRCRADTLLHLSVSLPRQAP